MEKIIQKQRGKNHLKLLSAILIVFLIIIIMANVVFATTFDNVKSFDEKIGDYGKITIKNWFGLTDLAELELKTNTDVCGISCSAETEIIMHKREALIDKVRFIEYSNEHWFESSIKDYKFYIKVGEEEIDIDDYEKICVEGEYIPKNETYKQSCQYLKSGSHIQTNNIWKEYNLGEEVEPGTY